MEKSMRFEQDRMSVQLLLTGKYRAINKQLKPALFDDIKLAIDYATGKNQEEVKVS